MIIHVKNKQTLKIDDFYFKCCVGKNGISRKKIEGDKKTPKGTFKLGNLYFRKSRINRPITTLKKVIIRKNMAWCDDSNNLRYNKLTKISKKYSHEKLFREDNKYDLLIPIKYNFYKPRKKLGSCIFIHLTNNYKPTAGCVALKKKDFLIMLKLINKNSKIIIY